MFRYYPNKDIDYELWDTCIKESSNGIIYALSWYLNIISPGWSAIIKEVNQQYELVIPITAFEKWGLKYLKQPLFAQQLGIFHIKENITSEDQHEILSLLNFRFSLISSYNFNINNKALFNLSDFKIEELKTYHLDLNNSYERIAVNYKKDKKQRLKQAEKANLTVSASEHIDGLIQMFNDHTAHKIPGVKNNKEIYSKLKLIYQKAATYKMTELYEIKNADGKVIAMSLFLHFKDVIIYFFSTSSIEGKQKNAIVFLLDYIIKKYAHQNIILDFEGSHIPEIADFYSRFGAEKKEYISISKNKLPFYLKVLQRIRSIILVGK